jgi:hypothetical protein
MSTKQPIKPIIFTVLIILLELLFLAALMWWVWVMVSTLRFNAAPPKIPPSNIQPLDKKGIEAIVGNKQ